MRSIWPCTWMIVVALTVGPRTADAYSFFLSSAQAGAEVHAGEVVTVDVWFDAEGNPDGILAFSVGVDFVPANPPGSVLDYRQDLSSTATYLLYVSAKAP